jgi:hypothetical protein
MDFTREDNSRQEEIDVVVVHDPFSKGTVNLYHLNLTKAMTFKDLICLRILLRKRQPVMKGPLPSLLEGAHAGNPKVQVGCHMHNIFVNVILLIEVERVCATVHI